MTENSGHPTNRKLKILQYNLAKGRETTDSVLSDDSIKQFTVLVLQEQYWSTFLDSSLPHQSWTLLEPTLRTDQTPRTAIYINNNELPSVAFTQVRIPFHDITAVAITPNNNDKPTLLINMYKPGDKNTIPPLRQYLSRHLRPADYANIIILGDFNLHYPLWNPQNYARHDNEADELVEMMNELHLRLLIPPGTITRPTTNTIGGTTIDLVWGNENAEDAMLKYHTISRTHDHGSDHYPIETVVDIEPKLVQEIQKPFNFAKTNWKSLEMKLKGYLPTLIDSEHTSPTELDQFAAQMVTAFQQAVSETTPRKKPCPHSKRWWNSELTEMRKCANRLRNIYGRTRNERDGQEWRNKRDEYKHAIKRAKETVWKQFVDEADERTIWMVKKYIDTKPAPYYIPAINDAMSNDEKATEFTAAFFPPPPMANLCDIESTTYPEPVQMNTKITIRQIERAIDKLSPNKAPGPDEITNAIIKKTFDTTQQHLLAMVQASINLSHFPACFKTTTTIVLRKPQKSDYTKPNAYRPIALENTLGKIIESVLTDLLGYLTETHNLLPANHFGGRPGRTGEDAMAILSEKIHKAWKERDIYSVIFMDVAGAFNNVHHQRLLHNMRKRRIPISIVRWVENFLTGRSTQLRFNGALSGTIATGAGVPQGSPMSPLLYMYYNADLLDVPGRNELGLGFIDDIAYGVQGQTGEENVTKLQGMLEEAEQWREKHGARFETTKYVLVHFTKRRAAETTTSIRVANTIIQPSQEAKYLGVIFDKQLRFKLHIQHATKKGSKFSHAMSRITKTTWGTSYQQTRRLFTAVVAPRIDYSAIIWYRPARYGYPYRPAQLSKLESAQRTAMKAVLSTFRTTPTTALEVESGLMPPHLRLQSRILRSYTCFATLPPTNPVNACLTRASTSTSHTHISPLEYLSRTFPDYSGSMETIRPYVRPPWWIPNTNIDISSNKKEAKQRHDEAVHDINTICIYTDGSGIEGQIGAAAVCQTTSETRKQYIGTDSSHNVYAAELAAIKLAVDIVQEAPRKYDKCVIYTDSQPAIKATTKPHQQSGQSILASVIDSLDSLKSHQPGIEITLAWVPGHKDIAGNEEADKAAKEAVRSNGTEGAIFTHKTMKSARNQTIKTAAKREWKIGSETGKRTGKHVRRITTKSEAQNSYKIYNSITKRSEIAMLSRLRTGHCSLNQYLHRFHHEESPECSCGSGASETVEHFLLHCPKYDKERDKLIKNVGVGGMWIEKLLGYPKFIKFTLD